MNTQAVTSSQKNYIQCQNLSNFVYYYSITIYVGCPGSISPFWKSQEPVAWPRCNFGSHAEETLLHIREQSLSCGASQSAVRRC
jgi:hypothetical protein